MVFHSLGELFQPTGFPGNPAAPGFIASCRLLGTLRWVVLMGTSAFWKLQENATVFWQGFPLVQMYGWGIKNNHFLFGGPNSANVWLRDFSFNSALLRLVI